MPFWDEVARVTLRKFLEEELQQRGNGGIGTPRLSNFASMVRISRRAALWRTGAPAQLANSGCHRPHWRGRCVWPVSISSLAPLPESAGQRSSPLSWSSRASRSCAPSAQLPTLMWIVWQTARLLGRGQMARWVSILPPPVVARRRRAAHASRAFLKLAATRESILPRVRDRGAQR